MRLLLLECYWIEHKSFAFLEPRQFYIITKAREGDFLCQSSYIGSHINDKQKIIDSLV